MRFNATDLLYIFVKDWRNVEIICKMSKNDSLEKTGRSSDQNFVCSDNPGQNIWNKIEKSNKTGQEKKSFISTVACFLTAIPKV